ncbi:hypothetical protein AVEN_129421-1 [Araneus ventricosus]|uniref:Uncharacterized protein n=1 Tax=Araneus ventricosus TaxID=182803 RepID=A0A4Y2WC90_ARAVE|nr:hypothetical protein AVEN_129421-1 [Araneus ventricosus]
MGRCKQQKRRQKTERVVLRTGCFQSVRLLSNLDISNLLISKSSTSLKKFFPCIFIHNTEICDEETKELDQRKHEKVTFKEANKAVELFRSFLESIENIGTE